MPFHSNLGAGQNHVPYNWTYNTDVARLADSGFVQADEGKLARQMDDNTLWMLTKYSPIDWVAVGSGGGLVNESYSNFTYGTVTPLKIGTIETNKRLIQIDVYFDVPFNPTLHDASFTIGTLDSPDLFVADTDIDVELGGTYNFSYSHKVGVNTDVYLTISPGTSTTTGSGLVYVRSEP